MRMSLNDGWGLKEGPLYWGPDKFVAVLNNREGWLDASLPCDIHVPLIKAGIVPEPLERDQCFQSDWIEQRSWWFKKTFDIGADADRYRKIELHMESLDAEADVWLNGVHLGHHRSAFYPFSQDVRKLLTERGNELLVRVTSGLEHVNEQDIAHVGDSVNVVTDDCHSKRGDRRRVQLRKPQYVYGWDWGPRVATCGIVGSVHLEFVEQLIVRRVKATTLSIGNPSLVRFELEIEHAHPYKTAAADVRIQVEYEGNTIAELGSSVYMRSGINFTSLDAEINDARLWWPNGIGEQPLYTVKASVACDGTVHAYPPFRIGIRTIALDTSSDDTGRTFRFVVNGTPMFCKGANWIPADSIYARVTDEHYVTLLQEAKEANFNMLRVWGGGLYEKDVFYESCDRLGLLIWHDFMFGCAKYPDDREWFRLEAEREMDYQTRRLGNHAALALWCGNNENHWGFDEWWGTTVSPDFYGGAIIYNEIAPRIVHRNGPDTPYWNSSPYGGETPNGSLEGDRHHWHDCMMNEEMDKRITPEEYDKATAKFVSEYGYVGPPRKSSIVRYHGGQQPDKDGRVWALHNNTFEKQTVPAGIAKHYREPSGLSLDDYLHYAGLVQGLMLGYSLEAFRAKPFCHGGLFWMYNDCWGEVGWTIIDYYATRKIAYPFVKRAFAPIKLIVRESDGRAQVWAINETGETVDTEVEYGYYPFNGREEKEVRTAKLSLKPNSRELSLEFDVSPANRLTGLYAVRPMEADARLDKAILRRAPFRQLQRPDRPVVRVASVEYSGDNALVTVHSDHYAHAVHFGLDDRIRLSDEYFDLLPGEARTVAIYGAGRTELDRSIRTFSE